MRASRAWAALLLAAALAVRLAVPAGFMPMRDASGVRIMLCAGQGAMPPMAGMAHHADKNGKDDAPHGTDCPFAALSLHAGGDDPVATIGVPPTAIIAPRLPALARFVAGPVRWLTPPLRAPPA